MGANDLQRQDIEQQEQEALQALMTIAAAGYTKEADTLALAAGLWPIWKHPVRVRDTRHIQFP